MTTRDLTFYEGADPEDHDETIRPRYTVSLEEGDVLQCVLLGSFLVVCC
jgi:hypothetical protein